MRLLPILWAEPPTAEDWARLSAAREAIGYRDLIKPVEALEGSPQPILAVGKLPTWMTDYAYVDSTASSEIENALDWCINTGVVDTGEKAAALLSEWMGVDVKYAGSEEHEGGVRFS